MEKKELKASLLLLSAAAIWGFAFVAQSIGAQYVGAFTFNGIRFALGSLSIFPLILYLNKKPKGKEDENKVYVSPVKGGIMAGSVLYIAAALQQIGLAYTTAGKAAFITGLYIVIVPLLGIFLKQHIRMNTWVGVVVTAVGLYFLSVTDSFTIANGDLIEIVGAVFWATHILLIDHFTKKVDALKLSMIQFMTCSILSLGTALLFEKISWTAISQIIIPLLYGGILSAGVAYTLQALGQKHAKPSRAAVIMSMEAVFAAIGGALILNENLGVRGYFGCALMLVGMLMAQLQIGVKRKQEGLNENGQIAK